MRLCALALLAALAPVAALAAEERPRTVATIGEASAEAAPDFAVVTLAAEAANPLADDAAAAVTKISDPLISALKVLGVAPQDERTLGATISPVAQPANVRPQDARVRARLVLSARIRDLSKMSDVIRIADASGARVIETRFDVAAREARLDTLRASALADAKRHADLYAQGLGMKLGPARTVSEPGAGLAIAQPRSPMDFQRKLDETSDLEAGAVQLHATVYVTFDLETP